MGCFSCTGKIERDYGKENWAKKLIKNNDVNNNVNNYHDTRRVDDQHHHHRPFHHHQHQHLHQHQHQHHGRDNGAASTLGRAKRNLNSGSAKDSDETKKEVPAKKETDFDMDLNNVSKDRKSAGKEAQKFTFSELAAATRNFSLSCFIGEGGFGMVYKGYLNKINQVVAIKQLDLNGLQGTKEFLVEVAMLSLVDHPNLVKLIGYCAEKDQRLLVYEYMPRGSLDNHLQDLPPNEKGLDWKTRMKIAAGAATGLEYLHEKLDPPIIYRDLKCSNILLSEDYHPKLSDFGLAKIGPRGDNTHVSTRVMGTYGYCAPEYAMTGQLTFKSDIYSLGVVLLELITGRNAFDPDKSEGEQNLVAWARPLFRNRKKFAMMADPKLEGKYPLRAFYQALAIAAMCLQEQPNMRPAISHVVKALNYLSKADFTSPLDKDNGTTSSTINMEHSERTATSTPKKEPEKQVVDYKVKGKEKVGDT